MAKNGVQLFLKIQDGKRDLLSAASTASCGAFYDDQRRTLRRRPRACDNLDLIGIGAFPSVGTDRRHDIIVDPVGLHGGVREGGSHHQRRPVDRGRFENRRLLGTIDIVASDVRFRVGIPGQLY